MIKHIFQKREVKPSMIYIDLRYDSPSIEPTDKSRIIKESDIVLKIIDTINSIKKDPDSANVIVIDSIPQ